MKLNNIETLYERYGSKSSGSLAPDDQHALKAGLDSINEISNKKDAHKFLMLLALLRESEVKSIDGLGDSAMATITGAFSGGDEGVYAADTDLMNARFIYELVQNVDDCKYKDVNNCKLNIQFDIVSNKIKLKYNELGFQPENVLAITGLGNSTKNHKKAKNLKAEREIDQSDLQEIGEKGIGFKSIFGLAKRVKITSQYFCFSIDREQFFVPIIEDYSKFSYSDSTILELTLDEGMVEELFTYLKNKYDKVEAVINENPILFLNKLTEIKYSKSETDYFGFRVSRSNSKGMYVEEETKIEYFSSKQQKNRIIEAYRFTQNIEYSVEECQARYGADEESTRKHKIVIIAPKKADMIKIGRIYSFFATEEKIDAPFIINAPFRLNSGRTRIDSQSQGIYSQNKWFIRTREETIKLIHRVYERLAEIQGNDIRYYIPDESLVKAGCAIYCKEITINNILTWNIFEDVTGKHWPADEVCMINCNVDIKDLIEIHSLLEIRKHLLNIPSKKINLYKKYKIDEFEDINEELLECALINEEKAIKCLRYVEDFEPNISINNIADELVLSYKQLAELSKFDKISDWINMQTFKSVRGLFYGTRIYTSYDGIDKNVLNVKNFCKEYGEAINKRFVIYLDRLRYFNAEFKNTIYLYDAVFGKNMLEDMAKAYRILDPKDKFFFPFLQMEAVSEEIDLLCDKGEEISDYKFLESLKIYRTNQKTVLRNQYKSILELIERSGTGTQRFFSEILQNIDDCIYTSKPYATMRWNKVNDVFKIYVEYNEKGFDRAEIRAITAIGDSTKKKLLSANTTGEKGIGFKSIFTLCSNVHIESGNFSFELFAEKPTIPEAIKKVNYRNGTTMIFTLKPSAAKAVIENLADENNLVKNCLCLKQLHNLTINQKELSIIDKKNRRIVKCGTNIYEYYKYDYPITIDNKMALYQRRKVKDVLMTQEINYLVPLNMPSEEKQDYCVYSTFPTQEKVNIPMIINMPLELDTARERILEGEWNKAIISQMMKGLLDVYDNLKYLKKEKLPLYFPKNGKVLEQKYGQSENLLNKIAQCKIFKLALKEEYVALKEGVFSQEFEYMLLEKYGKNIEKELSNKLLARDEVCYEWLLELFTKSKVRERSFEEICYGINNLFTNNESQARNIIEDKDFREALYDFLSQSCYYKNIDSKLIMNWNIIPIKTSKKVTYECYSEDIYAPGDKNIDSEKYKILEQKFMSEEIFNRIYSKISGSYKPIQKFTKDVIIAEFFEEICEIMDTNAPETSASLILEIYKSERNLFEEMYKSRKDFPLEKLYFKTRSGRIIGEELCYTCTDPDSQGCLDEVIVAPEYFELAKLVEIDSINTISSYKQIMFEIGRKELGELRKNKNITKKTELFNSIYLNEERADDLRDGMGYFELYSVTSSNIKLDRGQLSKVITLTKEILKLYAKEVNEISTNDVPIYFSIDFEFDMFEKDSILNEIEDELQIRKESEKLNKIMQMLSNCYYGQILRREPCCVRTKKRLLLILDSKIISDYDIIEVLKAYFLKYFNTELSINRDIHLYTRRGFENIATINSEEDDVTDAVEILSSLNLSNIEEIKDFICRPLVLKGVTYGGYAKTCPLCGARIDTELTGMRIYKTKSEGKIIPLISCSNCHENLKYSSNINIDINKLNQGILDMRCLINGFEWCVSDRIIRLGHRALIRKMNQTD